MVRDHERCGVVFRMKDPYNFYSFDVSQKHGNKRLVKAFEGKYTVLLEIKDGGILLGEWFKLQIISKRENLIIKLGSSSMHNSYELLPIIFNYNDHTHKVGTAGVFVNGNKGFYFDNFKIEPIKCWTPYKPKKDLLLITDRANIYDEDYVGQLKKKFIIKDPINSINGPSEWNYQKEVLGREKVIVQKSEIADRSIFKEPSMLILRNKYIKRGWFSVDFAGTANGAIGVVLKYIDTNNYYLFEIGGHIKENQYFQLRKKVNGIINLLKIINSNDQLKKTERENTPEIGYNTNIWYCLRIIIDGPSLKFFFNRKGTPEKFILKYRDDDIPYGLIGITTYNTKGYFDNMILRPKVEEKGMSFVQINNLAGVDSDEDIYLYDLNTLGIVSYKL